MDTALRDRLLALIDEDDRVWAELAEDGSLFEGYHPAMEAVHNRNADALDALLGDGWPDAARVGDDGAEAAWRIVQHAISRPDFQRRCLVLLCEAAAKGAVPQRHVAMLDDRIRGFEGRKQLYGTQFDWDAEGRMSPKPIEDPENVDARRASVGLGPLAAATAFHRKSHAGQHPPRDLEERRRGYEAWRRRVGWSD